MASTFVINSKTPLELYPGPVSVLARVTFDASGERAVAVSSTGEETGGVDHGIVKKGVVLEVGVRRLVVDRVEFAGNVVHVHLSKAPAEPPV